MYSSYGPSRIGERVEERFAARDTVKVDCKGGVMRFEKG